MANSGPHTNGSQFFILYKSAHHLDYKHTVFGQVVGGKSWIQRLEENGEDLLLPADSSSRSYQISV